MTHSKTNSHLWKIIIVFAVLIGGIGLAAPSLATDYQLEMEVIDPNAPPDVCPNIPGVQASIPSGMQLDGNGNCYTPTPPPEPPVITDLCTNLAGTQETLPSGYYRTTSGECYVQPTPPAVQVDVCPNIDGSQLAVPDGYYLDASNNCYVIPEPTDECPNIPGPQATIPDGMIRENNVCYTPSTAPITPTTPSTTGTPASVQRLPKSLQPIANSLIALVPEQTREWLQSLPQSTAQTIPYYIFLVVVLLALVPILQSIREAMFARQIALILQRERGIAEEKDNFVALASHYLRTPLTLMTGGLDTIIALGELSSEQLAPLRIELVSLDTSIGSILSDIETNAALKNISAPPAVATQQSVLRSGWFWGPIVGSVLLTLVANFFFALVGDKEIGPTNTFFQFLVATAAFVILYLGVRNLHIKRKLHVEQQQLIEHEKTIDEVRNNFISQTTMTLKEALDRINTKRTVLENTPSASYFNDGYSRIESILQKFLLLSQVQAGVDRNMETIDLHEAIDNLIVTYHAAISAKRLTVTNTTTPLFIRQNRLLFNFVLESVIDNAIKFNQEGGSIEIGVEPSSKMITVKVSDNGIGISSEKLSQLFKPFSRTTSAVEFNYEGLGFSLFLDKIIMSYTGGDINIQSAESQGTQLIISTPAATDASVA